MRIWSWRPWEYNNRAAILDVLVRPAAFANECGARVVAVTGASEWL